MAYSTGAISPFSLSEHAHNLIALSSLAAAVLRVWVFSSAYGCFPPRMGVPRNKCQLSGSLLNEDLARSLISAADRISPVYYCAAALGWPPTSGSGPQMPPPVLLVLSRASRATLPIHTYIRMHARTCMLCQMLHAHARLHACTHVSVHDVVCTHTLHVIHACTYV